MVFRSADRSGRQNESLPALPVANEADSSYVVTNETAAADYSYEKCPAYDGSVGNEEKPDSLYDVPRPVDPPYINTSL